MAISTENLCFENFIGFGSYPMFDSVMGSVFGPEDGFFVQEFQPIEPELRPFLDFSENLPSSSSSCSSPFSCSGSLPVKFLQSLCSELEKQRLEMDLFLQLENQRLRKSILEQETRQQAILISEYESRMRNLLLEKDNALTAARNKTVELQDFLKMAEIEAKSWEKKAKEKEAIVHDLQKRLNKIREKDCSFQISAQNQEDDHDDDGDAVSFSDSSSSSYTNRIIIKGEEKIIEKMGCKLCKARKSCVVFFPCRHLCSCKSCEGLLGQCPVCGTVKETSLEVFLV